MLAVHLLSYSFALWKSVTVMIQNYCRDGQNAATTISQLYKYKNINRMKKKCSSMHAHQWIKNNTFLCIV